MAERKLNVLALVTDAHGGFGGISQYNRDALEAIASFDTVGRVDVLPRMVAEPLPKLDLPIAYYESCSRGNASYVTTLLRCLWRREYDLIFCGHINLLPLAAIAKSFSSAPVVLQLHGIDAWKRLRRSPPWLIRKTVDVLLSVSQTTLDKFRGWCPSTPHRVFVLPNTFHKPEFGWNGSKSDAIRRKLGLEGKTVLMTLGRMSAFERYKGFDEIISTLNSLSLNVPNVAYLAAGDGADRQRLEELASQHGVRDRVIFTGRVNERTKFEFLGCADLFVMPSQGEGFGIVVLEALACGVPVVASRLDGTREAVLDGKLGILVDPRDPESIRQGILEGLKRPRGVPEGLDYFSYPRFAERLRAALSSVCPI